jgi:hypothetical protein
MVLQVRDLVDVAARAQEFGCRVPFRIALLPGNFFAAANPGEFCYHAATPYVRSAWQSIGLVDEGPDAALIGGPGSGVSSEVRTPAAGPRPLVILSGGVPLVAFFGAGLLGGQTSSPAVALGMVSTVLAFHPRCACPREVLFDAAVERPGGGCACLEYRGDAYGLVALARDVRRIWSGR